MKQKLLYIVDRLSVLDRKVRLFNLGKPKIKVYGRLFCHSNPESPDGFENEFIVCWNDDNGTSSITFLADDVANIAESPSGVLEITIK